MSHKPLVLITLFFCIASLSVFQLWKSYASVGTETGHILPGLWQVLFFAALVSVFFLGKRIVCRLSSDKFGRLLGICLLLTAEGFVSVIAGLAANFVGQ